jgi:hypothetical protein
MIWLDSLLRFQLFKKFINNSVVTQSLCEIENIEKNEWQTDIFSTITHRSTQWPSGDNIVTSRLDWNTTWKITHDLIKKKGWERKKKEEKYIEWTREITFFFFFSLPLSFLYILLILYFLHLYTYVSIVGITVK